MSLERAQSFYEEKRQKFRIVLETGELKIKRFIREALKECAGSFDEQTLAENLREELEIYKNNL